MAVLSDMGGRVEFYGPIAREPEELVFQSRAEARVFGLSGFVLSLIGGNIDAFRFAEEQLPRDVYLESYYRRMLGGCENLLVQRGYLGSDEVDARLEGRPAHAGRRRGSRTRLAITSRVLRWLQRPSFPPWVSAHVLPRVFGNSRPALRRPRFALGERVSCARHRRRGTRGSRGT